MKLSLFSSSANHNGISSSHVYAICIRTRTPCAVFLREEQNLILRSIQKPWAKTIYLCTENKIDIVLQKVGAYKSTVAAIERMAMQYEYL